MTSKYNDRGNEDIREYITSSDGWTQLALVDDSDTIEAVLDIPAGSRLSWSPPSTTPITASGDVSGGDSDISTPVEIAGTALYSSDESPTAGESLGDTNPTHDDNFEGANVIIDSGDTVTIEHEIQQPEL